LAKVSNRRTDFAKNISYTMPGRLFTSLGCLARVWRPGGSAALELPLRCGDGLYLPEYDGADNGPFSRQAGAASALMGSLQFVVAALISSLVSAFHNGTVIPMTGTMAICGLAAFFMLQLAVRRMALSVKLDASTEAN
jgi:DHA1 family bicyclomycin/chloramphenicol resistance-like MFS transporter